MAESKWELKGREEEGKKEKSLRIPAWWNQYSEVKRGTIASAPDERSSEAGLMLPPPSLVASDPFSMQSCQLQPLHHQTTPLVLCPHATPPHTQSLPPGKHLSWSRIPLLFTGNAHTHTSRKHKSKHTHTLFHFYQRLRVPSPQLVLDEWAHKMLLSHFPP